MRISTDELFNIEGLDLNVERPGRKFCIQHYEYDNECFCIQHYEYDNECHIIKVRGLMCLVEYYNWKSVTGAKLQAWVTVDMIRIKTRKDYV
jgi:hypothetical protein